MAAEGAVKDEAFHPDDGGDLERLIAFDSRGRAVWPVDQLIAAMHCPLRREVLARLSPPPRRPEAIELMALMASPPLETLGDVLRHPHPPIDLLREIKAYARAAMRGGSMPPDAMLFIYYGTIAQALVRWNQRITTLAGGPLLAGFRWAMDQSWADQASRRLFARAAEMLDRGNRRAIE